MNFFWRLSIVTKVAVIPTIAIIGFLIFLSVTAVIGFKNAERLKSTQAQDFPILQASDRLLFGLERLSENFKSAATTADEEPLNTAKAVYTVLMLELSSIKTLRPTLIDETQSLSLHLQRYNVAAEMLVREIIDGAGDYEVLGKKSEHLNSDYLALKKEVEGFQGRQLVHFKDSFSQIEKADKQLMMVGVFIGVVTIVLLLLVTIPVVWGIKKNLLGVIESLRSIAQENGDLTLRLNSSSQDEIGQLVFWFNTFMDKLQGVIKNVIETSKPVNDLAVMLNGVADGANESITLQSHNTDKAKLAIERMSDNVRGVADNASFAAKAAADATTMAQQGLDVVAQTVQSIQGLASNVHDIQAVIFKLDADSSKVGSVLDVIKGIAEQTNLLALNAAIEAARAGDQGRGFAVVADEVRTLASRTQQSTEEIQKTIGELQNAAKSAVQVIAQSSTQARDSVDAANNAGASLIAINDSIANINTMNENIACSTNVQLRVTQEVVDLIVNIHEESKNTASRAGALNVVSDQLISVAKAMATVNQQFRV